MAGYKGFQRIGYNMILDLDRIEYCNKTRRLRFYFKTDRPPIVTDYSKSKINLEETADRYRRRYGVETGKDLPVLAVTGEAQ